MSDDSPIGGILSAAVGMIGIGVIAGIGSGVLGMLRSGSPWSSSSRKRGGTGGGRS